MIRGSVDQKQQGIKKRVGPHFSPAPLSPGLPRELGSDRRSRPLPSSDAPQVSLGIDFPYAIARARDESGCRAIGGIGPKPAYGDDNAVTQAQQKQNVNQNPEPPSKGAVQSGNTNFGDPLTAGDVHDRHRIGSPAQRDRPSATGRTRAIIGCGMLQRMIGKPDFVAPGGPALGPGTAVRLRITPDPLA